MTLRLLVLLPPELQLQALPLRCLTLVVVLPSVNEIVPVQLMCAMFPLQEPGGGIQARSFENPCPVPSVLPAWFWCSFPAQSTEPLGGCAPVCECTLCGPLLLWRACGSLRISSALFVGLRVRLELSHCTKNAAGHGWASHSNIYLTCRPVRWSKARNLMQIARACSRKTPR